MLFSAQSSSVCVICLSCSSWVALDCVEQSSYIFLFTADVSCWSREHDQSSPYGRLPWPLSITAWEKHLTGSLREHSWLLPLVETNSCKQNKWEMCVFVTSCECTAQPIRKTQNLLLHHILYMIEFLFSISTASYILQIILDGKNTRKNKT